MDSTMEVAVYSSSFWKRFFLLPVFAIFLQPFSSAQNKNKDLQSGIDGYGESVKLEAFMGVDFNYRDRLLTSQYEALVNLTPGLKYHPWSNGTFAVQSIIPIFNQYGGYYSRPRIGNLTFSQQIRLKSQTAIKSTVGLFSMERWGLDLKMEQPLSKYLALEFHCAYTGFLSMAAGWQMSSLSRALILPGVDLYLPGSKTQLRLSGGHYLYGDNGFVAEGMRHFKSSTVGAYIQWNDAVTAAHGLNGGFKVTIMLRQPRRKPSKVLLRPSRAFFLSNNMDADYLHNRVFQTDPEENDRDGWFSPEVLPWGINSQIGEDD